MRAASNSATARSRSGVPAWVARIRRSAARQRDSRVRTAIRRAEGFKGAAGSGERVDACSSGVTVLRKPRLPKDHEGGEEVTLLADDRRLFPQAGLDPHHPPPRRERPRGPPRGRGPEPPPPPPNLPG